jgi:signal transduction histidine kinase
VAARTAGVIRCIALGYIVVQVAIWHSFFTAVPWRLAGPAAAAVCCAAVIAYLWRRRPGWRMACADTGVQVVLALAAGPCVPPAMRGDTSNWLYIAMASQLLVPAWFAPTGVLAPLALASGMAYWAGAVMVPAGPVENSPAASGVMLLAVAAVAWAGLRLIYRRAAAADIALARADRDSRAQYVALSRSTERREHERLLHDTVLNTLTALARPGGDSAQAVARCRTDVALMEYMLGEACDLDGAPARGPYGGLLVGIEAVTSEMRARGLTVHLDITSRIPAAHPDVIGLAHAVQPDVASRAPALAGSAAQGGDPLAADQVPAVPVPVAAAMVHAVREALANVARHAGTGEAWVAVWLDAPPADEPVTGQRGGAEVIVRDEGAGFDPGLVEPGRLGLRRSIIERVADWGGQASVTSAPGEGTVVSLRWTWSALPGQGSSSQQPPGQEPPGSAPALGGGDGEPSW